MAEPREAIASALSSYLTPEQVKILIDEILAINKRASAEFTCKKCKQRQMQWTEIPDAKAVADSLAGLLAQGFGRPQEASEKMDPIKFKRLTIIEDDDDLEKALLIAKENREKFAEKLAAEAVDGTDS